MKKNIYNRPAGEEMQSPFGGYATTFPPQFGGAAKGKRLNGQARRLTSPLWRSYAGPPQGTTRLREAMYS